MGWFNIPWSTLISLLVILLTIIATIIWAILKKFDGRDN